jgi:hypothetical protein
VGSAWGDGRKVMMGSCRWDLGPSLSGVKGGDDSLTMPYQLQQPFVPIQLSIPTAT